MSYGPHPNDFLFTECEWLVIKLRVGLTVD